MSQARRVAVLFGFTLFGAVLPGMGAGPPATFWGEKDVFGLWFGPYTYGRMAMTVGGVAQGRVGVISHGDSSAGGCAPASADEASLSQVVSAASSAPGVLRVTLGQGGDITLEGLAEGDAGLSLYDANGTQLEHFTIPVRAVTSIGESLERLDTDALLEGGMTTDVLSPKVNSYDVAAVPAIDAVASGSIALVAGEPVGRDQTLWLRGTPGWGHLVLTAPGGARAERDLYIAAVSRIKSVTLRLERAPWRSSGSSYQVTVISTATLDDDRKVMGPRCDYSIEGPPANVRERPLDGALVLERRADIELTAPGVYRITCSLGSASATVVTESP